MTQVPEYLKTMEILENNIIPVFDSYTHKNPSKTLINSAFFEGLFALKMC